METEKSRLIAKDPRLDPVVGTALLLHSLRTESGTPGAHIEDIHAAALRCSDEEFAKLVGRAASRHSEPTTLPFPTV